MADELPITTPVVQTPTVEVKKEKEDAGKYTIFKSSYFYGKKQCMLFINHGYGGHNTFSIVLKQGNYSNIHNLVDDESVSFVKNLFNKLTPEQKKKVLE